MEEPPPHLEKAYTCQFPNSLSWRYNVDRKTWHCQSTIITKGSPFPTTMLWSYSFTTLNPILHTPASSSSSSSQSLYLSFRSLSFWLLISYFFCPILYLGFLNFNPHCLHKKQRRPLFNFASCKGIVIYGTCIECLVVLDSWV